LIRLQPVQDGVGIDQRRLEGLGAGGRLGRLGLLDQRHLRAGDHPTERHRRDQRNGQEAGDPFPEFVERVVAPAAAFPQQHAKR
jgi:hypothetical protein